VFTELPSCLSEVRESVCRRCADEAAGLECATRASLPDLVRALREGQHGVIAAYLKRARPRICGRCTQMLLLHAIAGNVPVEEIPAWLDAPNLDLDGRTPRACIDADDFEPVFEALWLSNADGPVS